MLFDSLDKSFFNNLPTNDFLSAVFARLNDDNTERRTIKKAKTHNIMIVVRYDCEEYLFGSIKYFALYTHSKKIHVSIHIMSRLEVHTMRYVAGHINPLWKCNKRRAQYAFGKRFIEID